MAILSFSPLDNIGLQVPTYRPTTIVYPLRHRGSSFMRFPLLYYMAEDTVIEKDIRVCGEIQSIFDEVVHQLKIYNELNVIKTQYQLNMDKQITIDTNKILYRQVQNIVGAIANQLKMYSELNMIESEYQLKIDKQIVIDTKKILYRQAQICALLHSMQLYNEQNSVNILTAKQLAIKQNDLIYVNHVLLSKQIANTTTQYQTLLHRYSRNMIKDNMILLTTNNHLLYANKLKPLSTTTNALKIDNSNIDIFADIKIIATNMQLFMHRINIYNSVMNYIQQIEKYNNINNIVSNVLPTLRTYKNITSSINQIAARRQMLLSRYHDVVRLNLPNRYIILSNTKDLQRQLRISSMINTIELTNIMEYAHITSQYHQLKSIYKNINTLGDMQTLTAKNKVNSIDASLQTMVKESKRSILSNQCVDIIKQPHISQFSSVIVNATKIAKASSINIVTTHTQRTGKQMNIIPNLLHVITNTSNLSIMQLILCNNGNRIITSHSNISSLIRFGQICAITNIAYLQRSNIQLSTSNIRTLSRDKQLLRLDKPNSRLARITSNIQTMSYTKLIKSTAHNIQLETIIRTHKYFKISTLANYITLTKDNKTIQQDSNVAQSHLHRRLWFIRNNNQPTDSMILPSDYDYPVKIESFNSNIDGYSKFQWQNSFTKYDRPLMVKIYDIKYNLLEYFYMKEDYSNWFFYEHTTSQGRLSVSTANHVTSCKLTIFNPNAAYITIQHPKDNDGYTAWYAVAKPILAQSHPIPIGNDLGLRELPVPIEILVETINILLLMWSKFFMAFTGQTGTQAISGLCATFHEWITLSTSQEQAGINIKYYYRMWRWLRWESECMIEKAKYDPELTGNYWVEQLLTEMQDYMLQHHFNYMPLFKDIEKMDEHRNIFNSPDNNIEFILDKYKGLRNRRIEEC